MVPCGQSGLTILVGPNNCGKSALLDAIHKALVVNDVPKPPALERVTLTPFDMTDLDGHANFNGRDDDELVRLGGLQMDRKLWTQQFLHDWNGGYSKTFRATVTRAMGGEQRLRMLEDEPSPSLSDPVTPLARIFTDDARRQRVQSAVFDGIGHYPIVDHNRNFGVLRMMGRF